MAASARRFITVVSFAGWAMLLALALYGAAVVQAGKAAVCARCARGQPPAGQGA